MPEQKSWHDGEGGPLPPEVLRKYSIVGINPASPEILH